MKYPTATFLALAFGVSYVVGLPMLFAYTAWFGIDSTADVYLSRLFVTWGPGLAAIAMVAATRGAAGVRGLLRRIVPAGRDARWAAGLALLVMALSVAFLVGAGTPVEVLGETVRANIGALLTHLVLQFVVVAVGEELAWRGWLLPCLFERHGPLRATLLTSVCWGLWHGPLLLGGWFGAVSLLLAAIGLSFVMTWLWAQTGRRLFPVMSVHAAVNTPFFFWMGIDAQAAASAWQQMQLVYFAIGVVLVLVTWRRWRSG